MLRLAWGAFSTLMACFIVATLVLAWWRGDLVTAPAADDGFNVAKLLVFAAAVVVWVAAHGLYGGAVALIRGTSSEFPKSIDALIIGGIHAVIIYQFSRGPAQYSSMVQQLTHYIGGLSLFFGIGLAVNIYAHRRIEEVTARRPRFGSALEVGCYFYPWVVGGFSLGFISVGVPAPFHLLVATALGMVVLYRLVNGRRRPVGVSGSLRTIQRDGLPGIAWSQEVGTGRTRGGDLDRMEGLATLGVLIVATAAGFYLGGWGGVVIGLVIGGIMTAGVSRYSTHPTVQASSSIFPTIAYGTRAPSAVEQRRDAAAETREEDCEAFLELRGDEHYFCVARGDRRNGPLPVVEAVPWQSFQNFEEGTHRQWFRSNAEPDGLPDWGVVVVHSTVPRVVKVAESVGDRAGLIELLSKLQSTFIAPRGDIIRAHREAMTEKSGGSGPTSPVTTEAPIKPF